MGTVTFLDEWAAEGLTPVTLAGGREVRLRLPEPRDLIVRGLLPTELVKAVMAQESAGGLATVSTDNPDLARELVESMQVLAADSIRQGRRSPGDEWEAITVPLETYVKLPEADRELIESLVTATLGESVGDGTPSGDRSAREEAAATVDGYREFRDEPGRPARRSRGRAVEHEAVDPDRPAAAGGGAGDRPRARRAPRKH